MASIFLRQDVQEHWEDMNQTNQTYIMDNLIDKMCSCDNIQVLWDLEDVVYKVALNEYPENWRSALVKIGENLTKTDKQVLYGSLCALKGIVKRYKHVHGLERIHLHEIAEGAFPVIEEVLKNILNSTEEQDLMLMIVILKIFYLSNYVVKYFLESL